MLWPLSSPPGFTCWISFAPVFSWGWRCETGLSPPVKYFNDSCKKVLLLWIICVFVFCVSHAFASVHCCLVVTCWERAGLLALVGDIYCIFVTFPCGILGQVWYLIVLFTELCLFLIYVLLSPYLSFISFLYFELYVFGDDALIS